MYVKGSETCKCTSMFNRRGTKEREARILKMGSTNKYLRY